MLTPATAGSDATAVLAADGFAGETIAFKSKFAAAIAGCVQMTTNRWAKLFKSAGIKGIRLYHYQMPIGKKLCSQQYRATAIQALYEAATAGKVLTGTLAMSN